MYTLARGSVAARHCWAPLLGAIAEDRGGVGVQVGGLDVVPLLGAVAGCHCWAPLLAAIAGDRGVGVHVLETWCRRWLPLLCAIAGLPLLANTGGVGVHVGGLDGVCWLPLLGAIGFTRWRIGDVVRMLGLGNTGIGWAMVMVSSAGIGACPGILIVAMVWALGWVVWMASCAWFTGSARDRWLGPWGYHRWHRWCGVGCNGTQQRHHIQSATQQWQPATPPRPIRQRTHPPPYPQQWHPAMAPWAGIGVVALLAAIAGRHCWAAIAGDRGI